MTKGHKRSNRELKKPKQTKPKIAAVGSVSAMAQTVTDAFTRGKKRW